MIWSTKYIYIILSLQVMVLSVNGQSTQIPPAIESLPFLKLEADSIINAASLYRFFDHLKHADSEVISIVHIGDSHIQGDFFTGQMRRLLQADFGNAGRGLIFPYQVAHTNGPFAYKSSSNATWSTNRITLPIEGNTNGMAGFSISTEFPAAYILFQNRDGYDTTDQSVEKLSVFYQMKNNDPILKIKDWSNNDSFFSYGVSNDANIYQSEIRFKNPTSSFGVEPVGPGEKLFYGFVAAKNHPGVIYHSIGVNGAEFRHYNQNPAFFRQVPLLIPQLLIVSMGTNEAQDWKRSNEELMTQMNTFLDSLMFYNSGIPIILTTPIESWRGRGRRRGINVHVPRVRECIIRVAESRNIAVWDLYTIAGGYKSSLFWRRKMLFSHDMVHNSVAGYRLQGNLFYKALTDAYHEYSINPDH